MQLQFEKADIFCGAIRAMFQYMKKNYLWKMLRIQMLINPSLPFVFLLLSKRHYCKVLRNIVDIFKDFELFYLVFRSQPSL